MVDGVIGTVEPLAAQKNLALQVDMQHPLRLIHADELRIRQVLINLLGNALKFTTAGHIKLAVQNVVVQRRASRRFLPALRGWLDDRAWIVLSVEDTGVGIAPEEQAIIFEEFRQVSAGAAHPEGAGMGLAIAKKLVELHTGGCGSAANRAKARPFL